MSEDSAKLKQDYDNESEWKSNLISKYDELLSNVRECRYFLDNALNEIPLIRESYVDKLVIESKVNKLLNGRVGVGLPKDFLGIDSLVLKIENQPDRVLEPIGMLEINSMRSVFGLPRYFCINRDWISVYPSPSESFSCCVNYFRFPKFYLKVRDRLSAMEIQLDKMFRELVVGVPNKWESTTVGDATFYDKKDDGDGQ